MAEEVKKVVKPILADMETALRKAKEIIELGEKAGFDMAAEKAEYTRLLEQYNRLKTALGA
jgi:hypothetical protein